MITNVVMFVDSFFRVSVQGPSIQQIADLYVDWVLGRSRKHTADDTRSLRSRQSRIRSGIGPSWTIEQLQNGGTFLGEHGCKVDIRKSGEIFLLRFIHRDEVEPAVFWYSAARVIDSGSECTIEHAVGRDAPRDMFLDAVASPSRILNDIISMRGVSVFPRDLLVKLTRLADADDVNRFVDYVLTRSDRTIPVVVVSCPPGGAAPHVNVDRLDKLLRGCATVAVLENELATYAFSHCIAAKGLSSEHRCFNGAIHSYGPTSAINTDHRLWLGENLLLVDEAVRTDRVAGIISHRLALRSFPAGFFSTPERFDADERRRLAEGLNRIVHSSKTNSASASELELEIQSLRQQLEKSLKSEEYAYAEIWRLEEMSNQLSSDKDTLEDQLAQSKSYARQVQQRIEDLKSSPQTELSDELRNALQSIASNKTKPHDCLVVISAAFSDRVIVLNDAYKSAKKSFDFRHNANLMSLLSKLVGPYYDILASGKGDTHAAKLFGKSEFAARESETTTHNERAIEERTRYYKNAKLLMWRHLKIGAKESTAETIRVHFDWHAEDRKIIIGHCGEHLYRVD